MRLMRIVVVLAVVLALGRCLPSTGTPSAHAAANDPRVHLSWRAPYGSPRATPSIPAACPGSKQGDTLYVTLEPAQDESTFVGAGGEIVVWATPGDTLGQFWDMGRGGVNHGGLTAFFQCGDGLPGPCPWSGQGTGFLAWDRTSRAGRIRFGEVVGMQDGRPLHKGERYVLGRIVFAGKLPGLAGCDRPACLELRKCEFVFGPRRDLFPEPIGQVRVLRGASVAGCSIPLWTPAPGAPAMLDISLPDSTRAPKR